VTLLALGIVNVLVGMLAILFMIILGCIHREVHDYVFDSVIGLEIEKLEGIFRCGKVAIHAVGDKAFGVIGVGGGFPGVVGVFYLMAGGTELGSRGSDHGVIGHAKHREADNDSQEDQYQGLETFAHAPSFTTTC
jgi:hypothetical protein